MAKTSRDFTTRVAIEGEKEYTSALKTMKAELKELDSALKLAQQQMQIQGESEKTLTDVSKALSDSISGYAEKQKVLEQALQATVNAQNKYKEEQQKINQQLATGKEQLAAMDEKTRASGGKWNDLKNKLSNAKTELKSLGETTEENKEKQEALKQKIDQLNQELKELDQETNGSAKSAGELMQQQAQLGSALDKVNKNADVAARKAADYGNQLNNAKLKTGELQQKQQELQRKLQELKQAEQDAANGAKKLGDEEKEAGDKAKDMSGSVDQTAQAMQGLNSILMSLGIKRAVSEIADAFKECVNAAADFEYSMSTVAAVSGATTTEIASLQRQAIEYSTTTVHTAADLADGYATLARAGWTATEMLDGMGGIMSLASASGEQLQDVVSMCSDSLTAFGYSAADAGHFADVLAEASADSNTTVALLSNSFKMAATTAGNLGYSIDDVAVAFAAMANNGIKGEMAGSALATSLTRMSGANETAAKEMDKLKLSMFETTGEAKPLSQFLGELRAKFQEFGDDAQAAQVSAYRLAGQRGLKGLMAVVNASDEDWDALTQAINECEGAAEQMSDVQLDNYTGQVKLLESAQEALKIQIGNQLTPTLRVLAEGMTNVISKFTEWIGEYPALTAALTGGAAAVTAFASSITVATAALAAMKIAAAIPELAGIAGVAGVAALAVGGLAAAFVGLNNSEATYLKSTQAAEKARESAKSWEEQRAAMETSNQQTLNMMTALETLLAVENKDELTKAKIKKLVEDLNAANDQLNLSYDEESDKLNMTTEKLEEKINMMMKEEEAAAIVEKLVELRKEEMATQADYEAQMVKENEIRREALQNYKDGIITYEDYIATIVQSKADMQGFTDALEENRAQQAELEQEYIGLTEEAKNNTDATEENTAAKQENTAMTDEEYEALMKEAEALEEANQKLAEIRTETIQASGSGRELLKTYDGLVKEFEKLDGAGDQAERALTEMRLEQLRLIGTTKTLAEELPLLGERGAAVAAKMLINTGADLDEWIGYYNNAFDQMTKGFEALEVNTENTLNKWITAMDKSVEIQRTWNKNTSYLVNAANEMAQQGDPAMRQAVDIIMDGGIEEYGQAAAELQKAIENNDKATIDALVSGINKAGDAALNAAEIEFMRANNLTKEQFDQLEAAAVVELTENGVVIKDQAAAAAAGIGEAMQEQTPQAEAAATELITAVAGAATDAETQMAFENAGKATVEYMINGIQTKGEDVSTALSEMLLGVSETATTEAETASKPVGQQYDAGVVQGMVANQSSVLNKARQLMRSAGSSAKSQAHSSGYEVGAMFDQGVVAGLNSGTGAVYNAAYNVGQQAAAGAKAGADEHSPSKKGYQVGLWMDEGIVLGLDDGAADVYKSAENVGAGMSARLKAATQFPDMSFGDSTIADELEQAMNPELHNWEIVINAQETQNPKEIANMVMDKINGMLIRTRGAKARA